jgi:hypothetical protein
MKETMLMLKPATPSPATTPLMAAVEGSSDAVKAPLAIAKDVSVGSRVFGTYAAKIHEEANSSLEDCHVRCL